MVVPVTRAVPMEAAIAGAAMTPTEMVLSRVIPTQQEREIFMKLPV
ncbi:hypothetical protein ACTI_18530 [Actinoplanes sp. OR16]|nr:hypothetical protein ACTI_18530 [Actinoplanes sp. OR16]